MVSRKKYLHIVAKVIVGSRYEVLDLRQTGGISDELKSPGARGVSRDELRKEHFPT